MFVHTTCYKVAEAEHVLREITLMKLKESDALNNKGETSLNVHTLTKTVLLKLLDCV